MGPFMNPLVRYARWLHTGWPAGRVERLPEADDQGHTTVPGVRIVGDLTGVPLLKFAADSGARAVRAILADPVFAQRRGRTAGLLDLAIVGGGVSGIAAAIEAKQADLSFAVYEASEPFATVRNFPRGKPIFTYPAGMTPEGQIRFRSEVHPKETLLADLEEARRAAGIEPVSARIERLARGEGAVTLHHADGRVTSALRVLVAIGRSGDFRRLGVPGEDLDKVFNRLHDPADFRDRDVLVVGGGDSAAEAADALARAGARATLSYHGETLSRPKPENVSRLRGSGARLALGTRVVAIEPEAALLEDAAGRRERLPNDAVFPMLGRDAPITFLRRSGLRIRGEWTPGRAAGLALFFLFCVFLYNWKAGGAVNTFFRTHGLFPYGLPQPADSSTLAGTLALSLREPGFYYALAYSVAILAFGIRRIRRRRTPYVTRQTVVLTLVQWVPLFLLPFVLLPWLGHNGAFDAGMGKTVADHLFPVAGNGPDREYWRAFGLILAWPLFVWNVFSWKPLGAWLAISFVQTFVLIPLVVRRWGKGAYCGWICSCGALAETLGDAHRQKMPHGPGWNRLNMVGQAVLAVALLLFAGRAVSWTWPDSGVGRAAGALYEKGLSGFRPLGIELNYYHVVDVFLAGIVGLSFYFWFSGRVWCRFACPLAALMHVYARFTRFRIFADKPRCISCNVCTTVCHQGIDVMAFANKGRPMEDPECVRCSACVQACPTGVLAFGRYGGGGLPVFDRVVASPLRDAGRPSGATERRVDSNTG